METTLSSDCSDHSDNNPLDRKSSISVIIVAMIAVITGEWFPYDCLINLSLNFF